jgi:hypothetical protein
MTLWGRPWRTIYTQSPGEDAPLTERGIRNLRIMIAALIVPVAYVVFLAIKALT